MVPWAALVALIQPHARGAHQNQALGERPPLAVETMLCIRYLKLWWNLSDPAMEEELHKRPLYREFAGLSRRPRLPDATTICGFATCWRSRGWLWRISKRSMSIGRAGLMLKTGTLVNAVPGSTRNAQGRRDPEMHQTRKGNQWHLGMKAHIGVDAESGLGHTVIGTAANVSEVT